MLSVNEDTGKPTSALSSETKRITHKTLTATLFFSGLQVSGQTECET